MAGRCPDFDKCYFRGGDAQYQNVNLALKLNLLDVPGWIRGLANVLFPGISTDTPSGWSQPGSPGAYYEFGWLSHGTFGMFDTINVWGFRDDTITDFVNGNDVLKFSRNLLWQRTGCVERCVAGLGRKRCGSQ